MSTSPYTPGAFHHQSTDDSQPDRLLDPAGEVVSEPDVMKRDRFELLSAFLDGEVTPEERTLVQSWLSTDPTAKGLYNRLMTLRNGLRRDAGFPCCDAEVTLACVFQGLNRRFRMVSMASIGVIAIGAIQLLSGQGRSGYTPRPSMAESAPPPPALQIALDQPAFPIPTLPVAAPGDGSTLPHSGSLPVDSEL
ncbi:MAG TPA: zf-HC2 domain-containing protein [Leptolyngbyaceae cyanobacterium M65_K2018_010]|nr:zf-HC2 domain-containing protein [Leptolyngbyaceae cyanobacterium M65_K2018_010]